MSSAGSETQLSLSFVRSTLEKVLTVIAVLLGAQMTFLALRSTVLSEDKTS